MITMHARSATYPALRHSAPFAAFILLLALRPMLARWSGLDERALYALQPAAALLALWWLRPGFPELHLRPRTGDLLVSLFVGLLVFAIWVAPLPGWAHLAAAEGPAFVASDATGTALRWDLIALRLVSAGFIVPVIEEIFWRSFLMRWLDRRRFLDLGPSAVSGFALLASSAAFSLEHELWLPALVAGLAYGELYRRTGNLWAPILAHAGTNLVLGAWVVSRHAWQYW